MGPVIVSWAFRKDVALGYLQREFATAPDKKRNDIWTLASSHCRGSLLQCLLKQGGPIDSPYSSEMICCTEEAKKAETAAKLLFLLLCPA